MDHDLAHPSLTDFDRDHLARRRQSADVTFKGGLDAPFHRWFRLTPSYSPALVQDWLAKRPPIGGGPLLDPFLGAGTTCITAAAEGLDSIGIEVNPFLAFVGRTSTDWSVTAEDFAESSVAVLGQAKAWVADGPQDAEEFAVSLGTQLPLIHNVFRWWRPDVLREIVALREAIRKLGGQASDHQRLALAQIVYPSASITLGRLQIAFKDRTNDEINALAMWEATAALMAEDLAFAIPSKRGAATVINGNSCEALDVAEGELGGLFCSPPYPNRYSYVWNTRPHLYLLEMLDTPKGAADIDCDTIAGTWGSATTRLQKGEVAPCGNAEAPLHEALERLRPESVLMANYVSKYFNDLDLHLASVTPKLKPGAPVGYVVGNTETKGVMIETHDVLAQMLREHGFTDVGVEPLRARNSGQGLVEATVYGLAP